MAARKTTEKNQDTEKNTKNRRPAKKTDRKEQKPETRSLIIQMMPFILFVSALLMLLVLVLKEGFVVIFLQKVLKGLFSFSAFTIPVLLILLGVFWRSGGGGTRVGWRFWCSLVVCLFFTVIVHIVIAGEVNFSVVELYNSGISYQSGGVIGGFLGSLFLACFGKIISLIILGTVTLVLILLLFGLTPNTVYHLLRGKAAENRERRRARAEEARRARAAASEQEEDDDGDEDEVYAVPAPAPEKPKSSRRRKFDTDVDMSADRRAGEKKRTAPPSDEPDQDAIDAKIFEEVTRRTRERYGEQSFKEKEIETEAEDETAETSPAVKLERAPRRAVRAPLTPVAEADDDGDIDLSKIFVDPDSIELLRGAAEQPDETEKTINAERRPVSEPEKMFTEEEPEAPVPDEPEYEFPPLDLLSMPKAPTAANLDELKDNAQKLVDTLRSFNVRTKISDVFHGPTITRYELTPESGTRVRAIANLADDISLNLAAPGVRIEAPIPGKAAVGVEVPNKVRENVMLRGLLEADEFGSADSRLMTALGSDVAGAPVYCDIAKMPHLLVAGATGMGKSVCINSIVVSLLYKARPEEVRLIMIDPKKVEFGVYNGIPHLHVPVVTDPKKAAGTLAWAVGEMDRRYEVIESVGVRNIQGYNAVTENDPEKQFMPQMVIIIDELADLMMTAPDDVETSICRIAQMGRAAGIHLIIGTQRPSVDVITGLIKANIPSRIACKTSSQVDSRTIIDGVGAEKLLGRGDMLYAPVGVMKPQRVQGAFVSDAEVEAVTDFLKGICPSPHYDESAIDGIEEAARQCGNGKKGRSSSSDDGDDDGGMGDDPMIRQALELAVDSGKISTSLIQRRLSLGYGRAAKLIDRMEALGYVSAPDGQRPREVLITRQQFQELVLKDEFN